ncbi:unnamed protein product [Eretmochelys imbricata]
MRGLEKQERNETYVSPSALGWASESLGLRIEPGSFARCCRALTPGPRGQLGNPRSGLGWNWQQCSRGSQSADHFIVFNATGMFHRASWQSPPLSDFDNKGLLFSSCRNAERMVVFWKQEMGVYWLGDQSYGLIWGSKRAYS